MGTRRVVVYSTSDDAALNVSSCYSAQHKNTPSPGVPSSCCFQGWCKERQGTTNLSLGSDVTTNVSSHFLAERLATVYST